MTLMNADWEGAAKGMSKGTFVDADRDKGKTPDEVLKDQSAKHPKMKVATKAVVKVTAEALGEMMFFGLPVMGVTYDQNRDTFDFTVKLDEGQAKRFEGDKKPVIDVITTATMDGYKVNIVKE